MKKAWWVLIGLLVAVIGFVLYSLLVDGFGIVGFRLPPGDYRAASIGIARSDVTWNPWTRDDQGKPVAAKKPLEPHRNYDLHFDLASIPYSGRFPGLSRPSKIDPEFERLLQNLPNGFRIVVKPILLGEGLEIISNTQRASEAAVSVERLRDPRRDLTGAENDLPSFADHVNAARVTVSVHATGPGCAAIALSVWNREIKMPIDYVVRHYTVGAETTCAPAPEPEFERGRLSLLATPFERKADAAIHVFEIGVEGGVKTAAVFMSGGDEAQVLSWTIEGSLSDYLGGSGGGDLSADIQTARCHGPSCTTDYSDLAERLTSVLFTDEGQAERQADAEKALETLKSLAVGAIRPNVFLRLVDVKGNTSLLPLGLVGLGDKGLLGQRANLITPMPHERLIGPAQCVRSWKFVLPERMEEIEDDDLDSPITPSEDWIRTWDGFKTYATTRGATDSTHGEGLVLLAHQGGGKIAFFPKTSTEALKSQQLKHRFAPGSIALLAACSVGKLAADNRGLPLLEKLNALGLDAAIVSPFDVRPIVGARLALWFTERVEAARKSGSKVDLLELFRLSREAVRGDQSVKLYADELNEFLLVGNSKISLCPAEPSS